MKGKKFNKKGMIWEFSKLAILLGGVILFSSLFLFYSNFTKLFAQHQVIELSRNLGKIIDEVGSSPTSLKMRYQLPDNILGEEYEVKITEKEIEINLKKYQGIQHRVSFLSNISTNVSFNSGETLNIEKNHNNSIFIW